MRSTPIHDPFLVVGKEEEKESRKTGNARDSATPGVIYI